MEKLKILTTVGLVLLLLVGCMPVAEPGREKPMDGQDRVEKLQQKLKLLKEQLALMEQEEAGADTPAVAQGGAWQAVLSAGRESEQASHYIYLLGTGLAEAQLKSLLRLVLELPAETTAGRHARFIIPARAVAPGQGMSVEAYNFELASELRQLLGQDAGSADAAVLVVSSAPLAKAVQQQMPLLLISPASLKTAQKRRLLQALQGIKQGGESGLASRIETLLKTTAPVPMLLKLEDNLLWVDWHR